MADFRSASMWLSSSLDRNPFDFVVCIMLEKNVCHTSHPNLESLQTAIMITRDAMDRQELPIYLPAF
uniref:Uncharacterized protein n=1 Tax=Lepeophtheirus salmonis TaxID=72036 RepID=A0A0K2TU49_LEPSM